MNILRLVIQLNGHVMRLQEVQPVVQCHSTIRIFPEYIILLVQPELYWSKINSTKKLEIYNDLRVFITSV